MGDRVTEAATIEHPLTPTLAKTANVLAKGALVILMALAITHPDLGNMRDKAAGLRAVAYPALVPVHAPRRVVGVLGRDRMAFPWLADLFGNPDLLHRHPGQSPGPLPTASCGSTTGCTS